MFAHTNSRLVCRSIHAANALAVGLAVLIALVVPQRRALAEPTDTQPSVQNENHLVDPFETVELENDPFETVLSDAPVDAAAYVPQRTRWEVKQADLEAPAIVAPQQPADAPAIVAAQQPANAPAIVAPQQPAGAPAIVAPQQPADNLPQPGAAVSKDPCAAAQFKPLGELGIGIAQPAGQTPTDFATPCWNQINAGPNGACRCWPELCYQWDATCLCYRPLYFEEINAERYGYVCDCCLQPAASAAHFFATVPALPYCLAAEPPCECIYTLGHYRPGSCPPLRWHWPPWDPVAAITCAGVYTGFAFAIP